MSNKKHNNKKENNKKNNNKKFKVHDDVKQLANITLKKFKKKNDFYDNKKDLKKGYYAYLLELLPEGIKFIVRYGYRQENAEYNDAICQKICDPDFIKYLTKSIKKDDEIIKDLELLPAVIYEICREAARQVAEDKKQTEESNKAAKNVEGAKEEKVEEKSAEEVFDLSDIMGLSKLILKKKIKKLVKAGIDESLAFDILSVIPTNEILKKSPWYHIKNLFAVLYQHSKDSNKVDVKIIFKKLFEKDEILSIISFAMLEKRSKCSRLTDTQKALFNDITKFILDKLEDMKSDDIKSLLIAYVKVRENDEKRGIDSERRIHLSEISTDKYPKINKVIGKIIKADEDKKKYF